MKDINLEESRIQIGERWFSAEEIAEEIQKKIQAGDMKIATYASALERLTIAMETSHVIDMKFVITKDEYQLLRKIGKGDDAECIRKAIHYFISRKKQPEKSSLEEKYRMESNPASPKNEPDKIIGKCITCNTSMQIPAGTNPENVQCPECMSDEKDELSDSQVKFKDHFLG
jgi:hypothetical protein